MEENKKYIVLVTQDPYGRDDGFMTRPAKSIVLNNKVYDTKEEANKVAEELRKETSHDEIESRMHINVDLFSELREFIINNGYIHVGKDSIKNTFSNERMISVFVNMYGVEDRMTGYSETKFDEDEELYHKLFGAEPKIEIVEVNHV